MSVSIKYKGSEIASMTASGTKTLLTSGKYCEGDITVENTENGGGGDGKTWLFEESANFTQLFSDYPDMGGGIDVNVTISGTAYSGVSLAQTANGTYKLFVGGVTEIAAGSSTDDIQFTNAAYRKWTFPDGLSDEAAAVLVNPTNKNGSHNATKEASTVVVQSNKSVTITENGTTSITPDASYGAMEKATVTVNVAGGDHTVEDSIVTGTISGAYTNDRVTSLRQYAFTKFAGITAVSMANVTEVSAYAFQNCTKLKSVSFPKATNLVTTCFSGCSALESFNFPLVTTINSASFSSCSKLAKADFGAAKSIGATVFNGCSVLEALILRGTLTVCTLVATTAFRSTPISAGTGYIYVPSALVDSYKAATNWSIYADQIRAIEDYPEITG